MNKKYPSVAIVGAGPGDPELLTLKALRYIKECDVLLYDSLFGKEILELIPPKVEKIFVGKTYGDHQDQTERQNRINDLFLTNIKKDKRVVRLKTGNPLIFSRGVEEIKFLLKHKISFEIVPGITAGLAGACSLGVPLTERFNSSSVVFTTGHLVKGKMFPIHLYFDHLNTGGNMIIYMGLKLLDQMVNKLKENGFKNDLKFIIASHVSCPDQKHIKGDLNTISTLSQGLDTPAIIYIGKYLDMLLM